MRANTREIGLMLIFVTTAKVRDYISPFGCRGSNAAGHADLRLGCACADRGYLAIL